MATAYGMAARSGLIAASLAMALNGCGNGIAGLRQDMGWDQGKPASQQGYAPPPQAGQPPAQTVTSWQSNPADSAPIAPGQGPYVVQRGDTLYSISRRSGVPVRQVIDANGLQAPYQLFVGQKVTLPNLNTYTVAAGETLYSVSRKTHVEMSEIVRANALEPPYAIRSGQVLVLPSSAAPGQSAPIIAGAAPVAGVAGAPIESPVAPSGSSPISSAPLAPPPGAAGSQVPGAPIGAGAPPVASLPPGPPAAGGSSWVPVAPPPGVDAPASAPLPVAPPPAAPPASSTALPPPVTIAPPSSVGAQSLPPPGVVVPSVPTPPLAAPPVAAPPIPIPAIPASPPQAATDAPPVAPPAATQEASAAPPVLKELTAPPPRGGKSFLWPVKGRIIATYGEQAKGVHNDGINIAASRGTTVVAAENGVVAYAGNELRGFGNLLLIRHADGFMTAYAHNDELLVQRGDTVRRGQAIAKLGSTGSVSEPQLHFEVRKSGQPVDPEKYLGPPGDAMLILSPSQFRQRGLG